MILLAVTICLAANGTAECMRRSEIVPSLPECRKLGQATEEYLTANAQAPGVTVVFVGHQCSRGMDG